ncbi:DUF2922 family protein [Alkalibaculum sp. M08DMB]|uniref:DUF2922 family protein n=1 Tax=Alkalibaculum sporogenes TaxID=2655001 RepID=A0A6A7KCA3_9FIRM|nr:DUF2922 domain-containing protein [Alkalibaculum sporogenes]MPW26982.1 DUF2922 family protein [Alkalibaculum sporogenes]
MPTVRLDMNFKRADGANSKMTIDQARTDITQAEVNSLMDLIIANSLFEPNGSPLSEKVKIELVTTEVVEFDVV